MNIDSKIYIAGHNGLVGSAILKALKSKGYKNFVLRSSQELDLRDQKEVEAFFEEQQPEYVFLAAAKVGGIHANNLYRGEFIYDNLMIQNNVIHQSYLNKTKKLLFLGSTCIYPRLAPQPMPETSLMTDILEYTNEPYAVAKIAGIKLCESYNIQYNTNFLSVMPTNLFGPNDNFDLDNSHVIPAMIRKIHLAKLLTNDDFDAIRADFKKRPNSKISGDTENDVILERMADYGIKKEGGEVVLELWGTGKPMREFMWAADMADACVYIMENVTFTDLIDKNDTGQIRNSHLNIGTGVDMTLKDLSSQIKSIIGFNGTIKFDSKRPDGTPRKLTNVDKLHKLGWEHKMSIQEGLEIVYDWYLNDNSNG